jgi:hypothetical protein
MQRCPIVAPAPISVSVGPPCTTESSWTFAPARIAIGPKSDRITTLNQIETFSSITTSPMLEAVGAIHALSWICGRWPSNETAA